MKGFDVCALLNSCRQLSCMVVPCMVIHIYESPLLDSVCFFRALSTFLFLRLREMFGVW